MEGVEQVFVRREAARGQAALEAFEELLGLVMRSPAQDVNAQVVPQRFRAVPQIPQHRSERSGSDAEDDSIVHRGEGTLRFVFGSHQFKDAANFAQTL